MSFSLETYDRRLLDGMVRVYNRETDGERHIAPLDPVLFIVLVEGKSRFDPEGLFVAVEQREVIGWVHACVTTGTEPWNDVVEEKLRIRMLIFPRERLEVGRALVEAATRWLEGKGEQEEMLALHPLSGYPFYRGLWMGGEPMLPVTLPHLQVALEVGGYKNSFESLFMVAEMRGMPDEIEARVALEFEEGAAPMKHEPMQESWSGFEPMRIRALIGGKEKGHVGWAMLPHVAARLGAPCVSIWSLGVSGDYQRQGIGAALVSRVLVRAYAAGARFASLGTQMWNVPAHRTYAKLGFKPECIMVGRTRKRN
jgi:GNAT superfamily N-acetyltransferase